MRLLGGHKKLVRAVAFAPDGGTLATGGADQAIKLWDTTGWQERATLLGHSRFVHALAFSPDGRLLVSGESANLNGKMMWAWDMRTAKPIQEMGWDYGMAVCLSFTPDGRTLVANSRHAGGGGSIAG